MFAFNLFPFPPLDGGRVLTGLLPWKQAMFFARIEPYGFFIVMALVLFGVINHIWMQPVMGLTLALIDGLLSPIKFVLR
jgi:Zn-dependent protease